MRFDSIEVTAEQVDPGRWQASYRVIKNRQVVAQGRAPGTWETQKEAEWNGRRYAEVKVDGA